MIMIIIAGIILSVFALYHYQGKGVPVFLYHQVNPLSNIDKDQLEKHFQFLNKNKYNTFTLTEAKAEIANKGKLPANSVMITFDDGYYDNYLNVFPLLKAYNIKATIFLNTAYLSDKIENRLFTKIESSDTANYNAVKKFYSTGSACTDQYLSWKEIEEMHDSGLCDFQAHTHSHKVAFTNFKLKKIIEGNNFGREELSLYDGKVETGFPIFTNRGETSVTRINLKPEFIDAFQKHYLEKLNQVKSAQERLGKANDFVKNHQNVIGEMETENARERRIRNEIRLNIDLIEGHLKNKVFAFAWPYGHHRSGIELIKKEGITAFLTCKKGTNGQKINFEKIGRIELRKPSVGKFKWVLRANSNLLIGKLYGLIT